MQSAEPAAPSRLPKPESLEAKFKLLALLPYDCRVKRKHSLVYGFILDWFHSKYGNALASVRHVSDTLKERDPAGKGLGTTNVHGALSDLVAWGYLHQEIFPGRRASRYMPNWSLLESSVHTVGNTKENDSSVHTVGNTSVHTVGDANAFSVHTVGDKDPSTVTRPKDEVTGIDGQDCAAPMAPPPAGLPAAEAGTAQGFEELWRAYDYKKKKREARAAYAKLAPDDDLHESMVDAARKWQASWAAQNKPDAPRFHLDKWIEREEYECDPPTAYTPKERKAAKSADKSTPATEPRNGKHSGIMRIVSAKHVGEVFGEYGASVTMDGPHGTHVHLLKAFDNFGPADDNAVYSALESAFGDISQWPGRRVVLVQDGDTIVGISVAPAVDRLVEISAIELVTTDDAKLLVGTLTDVEGKPEGTLEIVCESDNGWEQEKGQLQLQRLLAAVDVDSLSDPHDLLFRRLIVTKSGDFKPAPDMAMAA